MAITEEPLRLRAEDIEDLQIISSCLQDALARVADMVNRVENIEYSIYFQKEAFNRQLEEAKALGQSLGVQVIGRAFFKDKERTFDPVRDCQWPNEEAIVFTEGQVTP